MGAATGLPQPALALILAKLYGATTAEVGWVLGIYNASGFVAYLLLPAYADKKHVYLARCLVCGALTLLLAVVLALATTLRPGTINYPHRPEQNPRPKNVQVPKQQPIPQKGP